MADDGILLSSSPDNGPMLDGTDGSGVHSLKPGSGPIPSPPPESEATIESELVDDELIFAPVESGYDLGTLLGRGGEGEVRAAYQRAFGRIVAIKRVRRNAVDPKRLRRFRAEALVTALLEHPHIVPIYDFRTGDSGELQLVMK
jgi:serine/threonine protein kinase